MKQLLRTLLIISLFILSVLQVSAVETVNAHLFYGEGCPHCAKERTFFDIIKNKYPQLNLTEYEIYYDKENNALLQKVGQSLKVE